MVGYDRHFRSSTTKSGSSGRGRYKQTEAPTRHGVSSEDDDNNFLTLEWDENLYDDDRLNRDIDEDENVVINSKITKHLPIEKNIKRHQSKEKRIVSDKIDDTIPDFGFINNQETVIKDVEKSKLQKEPFEKKIILNRKQESNNHK